MCKFLNALLVEEDGATMVEYALMVALIAAAAIATVTGLSGALNGKLGDVSSGLSGAQGGGS